MEDQGAAGDSPTDEEAVTPELSLGLDVDKTILMKENVRLGPFQTQILECRVKMLIGESTHVMVTPLRAGESQLGGAHPLPLGLHVLHMYTKLKMSSSKVSVVVRNMSASELAPPLSEEDDGEFPAPSFMGHPSGDLPLG